MKMAIMITWDVPAANIKHMHLLELCSDEINKCIGKILDWDLTFKQQDLHPVHEAK